MSQRKFCETFLLSKNNTFQDNSLYFIKLPVIKKVSWLVRSNYSKGFLKIPGNMFFSSRALEYTYADMQVQSYAKNNTFQMTMLRNKIS